MDGLGVSWQRYFLGKPVSKALYVFIKKNTWCHLESSQATGSLTNRSTPAAASVLAFLERTYWSIGETLPHEILGQHCNSIYVL